MMTTPTLVASPLFENTSCTALDGPLPEAVALHPVRVCVGRLGAAGLSPEGALAPWGGPAALKDCFL